MEDNLCIPITFDDGNDGIITCMLDDEGDETEYVLRAAVVVAQVLTGPNAGFFVSFTVDGEDFRPRALH